MSGGGGDAPTPSPPANGGQFLLQLLQKHPVQQSAAPSPSFSHDPAVAALGPSIQAFPPPHQFSGGLDFPVRPWGHSPSQFAPHNFFQQNPNPNLNPGYSSLPNYAAPQSHLQFGHASLVEEMRKTGLFAENSRSSEQNIVFGSLNGELWNRNAALKGNVVIENSAQRGIVGDSRMPENIPNLRNDRRLNGMEDIHQNSLDANRSLGVLRGHEQLKGNYHSNSRENKGYNGNHKAAVPPPGFPTVMKNVRNMEHSYRRAFEHNVDKGKGNYNYTSNMEDRAFVSNHRDKEVSRFRDKKGGNCGDIRNAQGLGNQLDSPGPPAGSKLHSASASDIEESLLELHGDNAGERPESHRPEEEPDEKGDKKKHHRDKDYRSDKRGQSILGQRMRNLKRHMVCRRDINRLNAPFLAIYQSLIPLDEEKVKQTKLLNLLETLVSKEWPKARLYLYGSCANSFGFAKSDIDVCLAMEETDIDKSEVLLKLADILQADNLQNVQALTRARVPIVKLMDPVTGISCDICVNNVLAVVNTKLLRDYAQIDIRLRQLAFIVKHWAKSRGVNETYQGTLSSYAYVLMCIHFLQQRRPAILPCLQEMEITYSVTIDNVECAYFDQVEKLHGFGNRNVESIAELVWAFFNYWAYCHDYANDVISVRMGSTLSKRAKDWTRRIGNDRHLICIEDPFDTSHDLGRVVDKYSIRVLREEFERAAEILQHDPDPCTRLFESYIPD